MKRVIKKLIIVVDPIKCVVKNKFEKKNENHTKLI